jgi:RNA polymerase sigma factor (sigma-70 family)
MKSDASLLQEYACTRSTEAFATLLQRHAGLVYGVCLRKLGNAADAEDVAQECFLELALNAGNINRSLPAWLHTRACSRAIDALRRRAAQRQHEDSAMETDHRSDEPSWSEIRPLVDEALEQLPDELRTALVMHFLQQKSQADIAAENNVNQSTVSRRISDGIEQIREQLKKRGVTASSGSLTTLLSLNAIVVAPQTLIAAATKIATVGAVTPTAAGMATKVAVSSATKIGGIIVGKKIVGLVAFLFFALLGGFIYSVNGSRPEPPPSPAASIQTGVAVQAEKKSPLQWEPLGEVNAAIGTSRSENGEVIAEAQPDALLISQKSWTGDSLVVEFDARADVALERTPNFGFGCMLLPYATTAELAAGGGKLPSLLVRGGHANQAMWSGLYMQWLPPKWKRDFPVSWNWGEFCAHGNEWYHVRAERIKDMMRLWVNGVAIAEVRLDEPLPTKLHVWFGSGASNQGSITARFKNVRVSQPTAEYIAEHAKPMKLFQPYQQKREILEKYKAQIVRKASIILGEKNESKGLEEVPFKGQTARPSVVDGKSCRHTEFALNKSWGPDFLLDNPTDWNPAHEFQVELEYLDRGFGDIAIMYNSWCGSADCAPTIPRKNSGEWVKHTFSLPDALWHHKGWNFWISCMRTDDTDLYIHSVRVLEITRPKEAYEEVVRAYQNEIEQHKSDWTVPHYKFRMAQTIMQNLQQPDDAQKIIDKLAKNNNKSEWMNIYVPMSKAYGWKSLQQAQDVGDF